MTAKKSRQQQRRILRPANERAASLFEQARNELRAGKEQTGPFPPKLRAMLATADGAVAEMIRYAKGEITDSELQQSTADLKQRFPRLFPKPPAWLSADLAQRLVAEIRAAERQCPDAPKQVCDWIRKEFSKQQGRRTDPKLDAAYREAARLRQKGKSWGEITRRLCPKAGEHHQCDTRCEDHIRLGASRLK